MLNISHALVSNMSLRIIFRPIRLVEHIGMNYLVFADVQYGFSELCQLPLKVATSSR